MRAGDEEKKPPKSGKDPTTLLEAVSMEGWLEEIPRHGLLTPICCWCFPSIIDCQRARKTGVVLHSGQLSPLRAEQESRENRFGGR